MLTPDQVMELTGQMTGALAAAALICGVFFAAAWSVTRYLFEGFFEWLERLGARIRARRGIRSSRGEAATDVAL
ncbi:MAG: hypothetical protein K0S37_3665 [Microbacterium sp.]|nr:hypothetical protein [Microbacterium sp.]